LRVEAELGPAPLRGNVALLGIAVSNLLENAVKYGSEGGLLRITSARSGADRVELTVVNDGPVLSADRLGLLFEPFQRGGRERVRAAVPEAPAEGAGLGLSIVRAVATAHGGSVTAAARPEGGLTVRLLLPAA
jgi:signal transduction histidine kinase